MPLHKSAELRKRTEKVATGATHDACMALHGTRIDYRLAPAIGTGEFFRHGASKGVLTGGSERRCDHAVSRQPTSWADVPMPIFAAIDSLKSAFWPSSMAHSSAAADKMSLRHRKDEKQGFIKARPRIAALQRFPPRLDREIRPMDF
jgi:hypothetical protein